MRKAGATVTQAVSHRTLNWHGLRGVSEGRKANEAEASVMQTETSFTQMNIGLNEERKMNRTQKRQMNYANLVDLISNMSKKDYKDLWKITKQYRKAHRMLEQTMARQEREFVLPNKSSDTKTTLGELNYELQ